MGKKACRAETNLLVDPEGNLLAGVVHRAIPIRTGGAYVVLEAVAQQYPRLQKIWAEQGDTGDLIAAVQEQYGIRLEVIAKVAGQQGFVVLPRRWVVERTCAWLGRYRRLSKEYEHRSEYNETWVYVASIARMLRTLHPNNVEERPYKRKKRTRVEEIIAPVCA